MKSSQRNVQKIDHYREINPVFALLSKHFENDRIGLGSLLQVYTFRNNPYLIVTDTSARKNVPLSVVKTVAERLDLPAMAVDFSAYEKETFLGEMELDIKGRGISYPKFKDGKKLVTYKSLRNPDKAGPTNLKSLALDIMKRLDNFWLREIPSDSREAFLKSRKQGYDPATQMDRNALDPDPDNNNAVYVAPLNEETYKLLDEREDWLSFLTRSINSDSPRFTPIDLDCVLYDKETSAPLFISEVKHGNGHWNITKAIGERLDIPAGLIKFRKDPLIFDTEGFNGIPQQNLAEIQLVEFLNTQVEAVGATV